MAALNYARMPGPGDLPGDSNNPNSPDYVAPVFDRDDAAQLVAYRLHGHDEVAELVRDVADAHALLGWIGQQAVIPPYLRAAWLTLERHAKSLDAQIDRELAVLTGEAA